MNRVVVIGMAGCSPIGNDWHSIRSALAAGTSGVKLIDAWTRISGMKTRLGALVEFEPPAHFNRKTLRTMGRVAQLAVRATELALEDEFAPTLNLDEIDPACAPLDYIRSTSRTIPASIDMTNNFAFGGINTSLLFKRWDA